MSVTAFGGLWTYPSATFPEHDDFMFVDEGRSRILSFLVIVANPIKRSAIRNWYQSVSAAAISVRLRPADAWRVHEFKLEGDRLTWVYGTRIQEWKRVTWVQRPEWLDDRIAAENATMDTAEQNASGLDEG